MQIYPSDDPLRVRFQVKGKLIVGTTGAIGDPIEAFEKLYFDSGGRYETITRLSQLKGKVKIASPEAALDFVRLRTSRRTWYLVVDYPKERAWAEVYVTGANDNSGYFGACPPAIFARLGLKKTSVQALPDGFLVRRNIIHDNNRGDSITNLFAIEEKVFSDGGYAVLKARRVSVKPFFRPFCGFSFPRFE